MNLSVKHSLSSSIALMDQIIEAGEASALEDVQCMCEIVDQAHEIKIVGKELLQFCDDLSHAEHVLVANGYSQELLNTLNADGKFLDAVNIDLTNLLGSDQDKFDACMEGLWETIKNAVLKVWDWIMNAIKTIVKWIRMLWAANRNAEGQFDRAIDILRQVEEDKKLEVMNAVGGAINALGTGGKMWDIRDLAVRVSVSTAIIRYICHICARMYDERSRTMSDWFMEAAIKAAKDKENKTPNPLTKEIVDTLNTDPMKFFINKSERSFTGFNGFIPVEQPATLKDAMKSAGIEFVHDGNDYSLKVEELVKCVNRIDYAAIYSDIANYVSVIEGLKQIVGVAMKFDKFWEMGYAGGSSVKDRLERCKKVVTDRMNAYRPTKENPDGDKYTYDVNRWMSIWIGRLIMIATRAQLDSMTCRQKIQAVTKTFVAKMTELSNKDK